MSTVERCPFCGGEAEIFERTPYGLNSLIGGSPWARCKRSDKMDCCPGAVIFVSVPIWNRRPSTEGGE